MIIIMSLALLLNILFCPNAQTRRLVQMVAPLTGLVAVIFV